MLWNKTYGGTANEGVHGVIQTIDGGFMVFSTAESFGFGTAGINDMLLIKFDSEQGLAQINSTSNSVTLYRGATDAYWNFVRVRIWKVP